MLAMVITTQFTLRDSAHGIVFRGKKSNLQSETDPYHSFHNTRRRRADLEIMVWYLTHVIWKNVFSTKPLHSVNTHVQLDPVHMLTTKPTYTASAEDEEREKESAFCWQTFSLGLLINVHMTHRATVLTPCLKGQWGWEKPTGQQAGKGMKAPQLCPWSYLKGDLPQMSHFCKNCQRGLKRIRRVTDYSQGRKDGWRIHLWWKQDFISQGFQIQSTAACEEEMLRHSEVNTKVPAPVIFSLHCSHNHLLNKHKLQPHIRLVQQ